MRDELNPYASPVAVDGEPRELEVVLPAEVNLRYIPRDFVDLLSTLALAPVISGLFLVLPGLVYYWWTLNIQGALVVGGAVFVSLFLGLGLPSYRRVKVHSGGIELVRHLGPTRRIPVHQIKEIRRVTRIDALLRMVWPGIPPKSSIYAGSTRDQYRIDWKSGYCYFAAAQPQILDSAMRLLGLPNVGSADRETAVPELGEPGG